MDLESQSVQFFDNGSSVKKRGDGQASDGDEQKDEVPLSTQDRDNGECHDVPEPVTAPSRVTPRVTVPVSKRSRLLRGRSSAKAELDKLDEKDPEGSKHGTQVSKLPLALRIAVAPATPIQQISPVRHAASPIDLLLRLGSALKARDIVEVATVNSYVERGFQEQRPSDESLLDWCGSTGRQRNRISDPRRLFDGQNPAAQSFSSLQFNKLQTTPVNAEHGIPQSAYNTPTTMAHVVPSVIASTISHADEQKQTQKTRQRLVKRAADSTARRECRKDSPLKIRIGQFESLAQSRESLAYTSTAQVNAPNAAAASMDESHAGKTKNMDKFASWRLKHGAQLWRRLSRSRDGRANQAQAHTREVVREEAELDHQRATKKSEQGQRHRAKIVKRNRKPSEQVNEADQAVKARLNEPEPTAMAREVGTPQASEAARGRPTTAFGAGRTEDGYSPEPPQDTRKQPRGLLGPDSGHEEPAAIEPGSLRAPADTPSNPSPDLEIDGRATHLGNSACHLSNIDHEGPPPCTTPGSVARTPPGHVVHYPYLKSRNPFRSSIATGHGLLVIQAAVVASENCPGIGADARCRRCRRAAALARSMR